VSAIRQANRSVFIENLYFSSGLLGDESMLEKILPTSESQNGVLRAVWSRLKRAVDDGQVDGSFSVVVVLPAATEEAFTQSINQESLWSKKRGLIPTLQRYLSAKGYARGTWKRMLRAFCLAKTFPMPSGAWNFMTIYIHAKVLIVDGKVAVVGSANLNDRSLLGTGDSELDLRIDGDFALSLQRRLLGHHAPTGYDELRLAGSLGEIADANWGRLESAWPAMFNASHRAGAPVFSYSDISKVVFGMFIPRSPASLTMPALDGNLIPWQEDLWGNATWQRAVDKLPWLGPAIRSIYTKVPAHEAEPSQIII
jgi:phosphatidylserine/phosphatidylglycerophosphate/cardiolipin synthase-like enzyme